MDLLADSVIFLHEKTSTSLYAMNIAHKVFIYQGTLFLEIWQKTPLKPL